MSGKKAGATKAEDLISAGLETGFAPGLHRGHSLPRQLDYFQGSYDSLLIVGVDLGRGVTVE